MLDCSVSMKPTGVGGPDPKSNSNTTMRSVVSTETPFIGFQPNVALLHSERPCGLPKTPSDLKHRGSDDSWDHGGYHDELSFRRPFRLDSLQFSNAMPCGQVNCPTSVREGHTNGYKTEQSNRAVSLCFVAFRCLALYRV
jgi:hypothetical protein